MKRIIIIAATCVALTSAARAETTWSATGSNGGSVTGSGSCAKGGGSVSCNRESTLTGKRGRVFDRTANRVTDPSGTVKSFSTTGAKGHSVSSTRSRSHTRGN